MFCLICGKELENGAKFCRFCGAVTAEGAAAGSPAEPVPGMGPTAPAGGAAQGSSPWTPTPEGGKNRRGTALIIGGAVAAVAVIALIVVLVSGVFSSPKGKVEKALAKTIAAYAEIGTKMGLPQELPNIGGAARDQSGSQRVSVELSDINRDLVSYVDLSALEGLGFRANSDWDQKGRKMDCDVAVFLDGDDIMSFQVLASGSNIYLASREFTKGDVYGVNTETLGADLDRLGADGGEVDLKKISFNIFDLMEKLTPGEEQTKEVKTIVSNANKALFDAITVEKGEKKSVQVNGKSVDATLYKVVIPEDAMKDYISAMEDAMKAAGTDDLIKDVLLSMGLDKSTVNQLMSGMKTGSSYKEITRSLKQVVKAIGDVELDVYVNGGYLTAVEYSERIEGEKVEIGLYLGGGDNYVDDLSLEISVDGNEVVMESSGNHTGDKGVFTDKTTIQARSGRSDMGRVTSEFRYEPKAGKNNFEWEIDVDSSATVEMIGQLTTTKNSIDLKLDEITVSAMRMEMLSLKADYYLGPCQGMQVSLSGGKMLADMDEDDLEDLYYDIQENIEDWAADMEDVIPGYVFRGLYLF